MFPSVTLRGSGLSGQLYHKDEMPEHFHEHFIVRGYRHPKSSAWQCILSLFDATNETLNFWTHFLPSWYFLWVLKGFADKYVIGAGCAVVICTTTSCMTRFMRPSVVRQILRLSSFATPYIYNSFPIAYRLLLFAVMDQLQAILLDMQERKAVVRHWMTFDLYDSIGFKNHNDFQRNG
nr:hypothetical protein BaRGS_007980 [Batillaria attramentaria]